MLLFRADGTGLYLSLSVATGRPFGTPNRSQIKQISNRALRFRPWFSSLQGVGLGPDPSLDLRIERGVGVGYRYGSVVHKFYSRNSLPTEPDLEHDILALTAAYSEFCSRGDARDLYQELAVTENELTEQAEQKTRHTGKRQGFAVDSEVRSAHGGQRRWFRARVGLEVTRAAAKNRMEVYTTTGPLACVWLPS